MDKEQLIKNIQSITNPVKEKQIIYDTLTELNIPFKKTSCSKCINDLLNICKEELGIIGNAAEISDFNTEKVVKTYKYIHGRAVILNGKKYGDFSGQSDLEELYKKVGFAYVSVM